MDRTIGSSVAGAAGLRAYYVAVGSADAKLVREHPAGF